MKTEARYILLKHRSRVRFYATFTANAGDDHPVDLEVQRWLQHARQQRRMLNVQEQLLARLAPDARSLFIELEELRNAVAADREEAYFDVGVAAGIESARRQQRRRLRKVSPIAARFAARVRRCLDRPELEPHEGVLAVAAVLAECATSLVEFHADEGKSRRRRGVYARST